MRPRPENRFVGPEVSRKGLSLIKAFRQAATTGRREAEHDTAARLDECYTVQVKGPPTCRFDEIHTEETLAWMAKKGVDVEREGLWKVSIVGDQDETGVYWLPCFSAYVNPDRGFMYIMRMFRTPGGDYSPQRLLNMYSHPQLQSTPVARIPMSELIFWVWTRVVGAARVPLEKLVVAEIANPEGLGVIEGAMRRSQLQGFPPSILPPDPDQTSSGNHYTDGLGERDLLSMPADERAWFELAGSSVASSAWRMLADHHASPVFGGREIVRADWACHDEEGETVILNKTKLNISEAFVILHLEHHDSNLHLLA